jgi:hypothetical protein
LGFSEPPNLAVRWHSAQEKKTCFRVELKTAVTMLLYLKGRLFEKGSRDSFRVYEAGCSDGCLWNYFVMRIKEVKHLGSSNRVEFTVEK